MADPLSTSLRVIRSLASKADDAPRAIRAYHGSPHSFPRFDASKIGTGEGAQAYGHGLYFAGNEDTARYYRDILAEDEELPIPWPLSSDYAQAYQKYLDLSTKAGEWGRLNAGGGAAPANPFKKPLEEASALWQELRRQVDAATKRPGHMYEVEIGYPEEALLDWDRPLWSQSDSVTAGLRRVDPRVFGATPEMRGGAYGGWLWKTPRNTLLGSPDPAASPESLSFWDTHKGSRHAGAAFADLESMAQSRANASAALRDAGIPGIRYLDQGSRAAGQGTHNYVIFPGAEDRIKILRQYGLLPPLMAPALMENE